MRINSSLVLYVLVLMMAGTVQANAAPTAGSVALSAEKISTLMEEARQAFATGNLDRAVAIYTRITELDEHPGRASALEFLGVARQRKGQLAHPKAVFDRYLSEYPDGEGHTRVKQRLAAIKAPPRSARRSTVANNAVNTNDPWDYYGSHSSYFRSNTVSVEQSEDINNLSLWQGGVDFIARRQGAEINLLTRVSAGYRQDFTDVGRDRSGLVVSKGYMDISMPKRGVSTRLGRQSRRSGGVYGRFDGVHAGWNFRDDASVHVVAGYPVQRSTSSLEIDRSMYGVSLNFEAVREAWNFGVFANNHTVDGIADRRGLGGEFRYYDSNKNIYGLIDYDALYSSVNAAMMGATVTTANRRSYYGTLDYRRSPLLSTTNAIIGQGVTSLNELSVGLTEDELQALAEDNTATSVSATIGFSLPLSERLQLTTNVQMNKLDTAVNFASFAGASASTTTTSINTQLVATSWLRQSDAWILGMRVANSESFRIFALNVNTRMPITKKLRINPLVRLMYRQNQVTQADEWIITPGVRASWRWARHFVLEFDAHHEASRRSSLVGDSDRSSMYYSVGYRANFGR